MKWRWWRFFALAFIAWGVYFLTTPAPRSPW